LLGFQSLASYPTAKALAEVPLGKSVVPKKSQRRRVSLRNRLMKAAQRYCCHQQLADNKSVNVA